MAADRNTKFGLGLPHFYGQFDIVHARSTANGVRDAVQPSVAFLMSAQVRDYERFIEECVRCLRPGGILLLVEGDMILFGEDLRPYPMASIEDGTGGSWMARMLYGA